MSVEQFVDGTIGWQSAVVTPRLGASLLSAQYVHKTASLLLCFHEAQKREIRPGHIGTRDTARSDDDFIRPP